MQNPYDTLGVSRDASADDIKRAYRKLSKEWHPDRHKGDKAAENKFKDINQAYEVLSDPQKKSQYDRFGSTGGQGFGGGAGGFDFSGFNVNGQGAPDLEDLFGSFFGGGTRRQRAEGKGQDLETQIEITLTDVLHGTERTMNVRRLMPCDTCKGSGSAEGKDMLTCDECGGTGTVVQRNSSFFGVIEQRAMCGRCGGSGKVPKHPCTTCSGEGRTMQDDTLTVRIPAGVEHGQTLRVPGGGGAGRRSAPAGDLFVHVRVQHDPRFTREGDDVHSAVRLHVLQAMLGDDIDVDTLHGSVRLKVPEGTQPGQVLRIKGKGLPSLSSGRLGNHHVHVTVDIPTKLSKHERKLLEEWKTLQ